MAEKYSAQYRNLTQQRDWQVADTRNALGAADKVAEERSSGADTEHLKTDTGYALRRAECYHNAGKENAQRRAHATSVLSPQNVLSMIRHVVGELGFSSRLKQNGESIAYI